MPGGTRPRPVATFSERSRSDTRAVYGCPRGTEVGGGILLGIVGTALWASISHPLWKADFVRTAYFATALFLGMSVVGWCLFSIFHSTLILDFTRGRVSCRRGRFSWGAETWALSRAEVSKVSLWVDDSGVAYLEVTRADGGSFVLDSGIDEGNIRRLAADLARCWIAPLKDAPPRP
jgi:hypothetical protein